MKTLTIIKSIGAGVTALYHAVEAVKYTQKGAGTEARRCADEWLYAVDCMKNSLEELQANRPSTPVNNITIEGVDPSRLNEALDEVIKWERSQP